MGNFTKTVIVAPDNPDPNLQTINQGIAALLGYGGVVIAEQGTYEIDGVTTGKETIEVPSNVTIIGRGNAVIEVTGNYSAFKNADQTNGNERIQIEGFKIQQNCSELYEQHLILMNSVTDSVLERLYIEDTSTIGVEALNGAAICFTNSCTGNTLSQCTIAGFGKEYVAGEETYLNYGFGVVFSVDCERNTIKNNSIQGCSTALYLRLCNNNIITSNVISDTSKVINQKGGTGALIEDSEFTSFRNNQLYNTAGKAVYISSSNGCTITGNVCHNCLYGFHICAPDEVKNNTIIGNIVSASEGDGNNFGMDLSSFSHRNVVMGNTFFDNGSCGIYQFDYPYEDSDYRYDGAYKNLITGNIAHGNGGEAQIRLGSVIES